MGWQQKKGRRTSGAEHLQGKDPPRTPGPVRWAQEPPDRITCPHLFPGQAFHMQPLCSCEGASGRGDLPEVGPHLPHHCSLLPPLLSRSLAGKAVPRGSSALPTVKRWAPKKGGRRWAGQEVSTQQPEMEMETGGPEEVGGQDRVGQLGDSKEAV